MVMAGCASRNKSKSTTTSEIEQSSQENSDVSVSIAAADLATIIDNSECNDTELEAVYNGKPDSLGNYVPARFTEIKNGDTVRDILMTGPGSFKFKDKSSSKQAFSTKQVQTFVSEEIKAASDTKFKQKTATEVKNKTVRSTWIWQILLIVAIILIGRNYIARKGWI